MIAPALQTAAQTAAGRVLNSLPEGLLIAASAWLLLRLMGRQNSGTRFAVWMIALLGVAALPFLGSGTSAVTAMRLHPAVTIPAFWALAFSSIWIAAGCLALARVVAGVWQVRRLRGRCTPLAAEALEPALREILHQTSRPVQLLLSEEARVPAAIGFLKPAIVLPAWTLRDLSADELQPILIHELAHLRRRDDWTNLLQKAVRAVLFFHPAVWWIDARLSLEREMACDDAVLAQTGNPRGYAGCLIELLEKSCARRGWSMAQAAVARAREASLRIARILQMGAPATTRVGRGALALAGGACITCCGVLISAPRLFVFAPGSAASSNFAELQPRGVTSLALPSRTPAAAVVPAMFHPAQQPTWVGGQTHSLVHKAVLKHSVSHSLAGGMTVAAAHTRAQVVEASLWQTTQAQASQMIEQAQERTAQSLVVMLSMQQPDEQRPPARTAGSPASLRTAATETIPVQALQAVEVQTLQIVEEDGAGFHVHTYRVVFLIPEQNASGSIAQSI